MMDFLQLAKPLTFASYSVTPQTLTERGKVHVIKRASKILRFDETSKAELLHELKALRGRVAELEQAECDPRQEEESLSKRPVSDKIP